MPLTFEEVDDWTRRTGTLEALQGELSQRTTTLSGLQDQLSDIRRLDGWEGSAAHAARQSFDPVDDDIAKAAAAVGAVRTQVGETIADLTEVSAKISEAKQFASANGYAIHFNGNIVDLWDLDDKANASPAEMQRHEEARVRLMEMVTEIVSRGNEIESEASRVLWAANQGDIGTEGLKDADQAAIAGAHFALESDADPQEVEDWWNGLSPNTVYLRGDGGAAVDRWRVAVVGVFELVARHFAFDDARIGAGAARGEQLVEDFGGDGSVRVAEDVRGKNRGGLRSFAERPGVIG